MFILKIFYVAFAGLQVVGVVHMSIHSVAATEVFQESAKYEFTEYSASLISACHNF
jgi:hypothetical protein